MLFCWGCDYARMNETESVKTYEAPMPEMPEGTIPIQGGLQVFRDIDVEEMKNPLPYDVGSVARGKRAFGYFCIMCHGPKGEGYGTVGQSFYPLPANLMEDFVQEQTDGDLFYTITFGYERHPPLGDTAAEIDRWAIVHFIRSLARES
jgi:mono/diheme cytochrome c family protein